MLYISLERELFAFHVLQLFPVLSALSTFSSFFELSFGFLIMSAKAHFQDTDSASCIVEAPQEVNF